MVSREEAARLATAALSPIQGEPNAAQVVGVGTLFAALCSRLGLDPAEVHGIGRKVLREAPFHRGANNQLEALRDFAGDHLADDDAHRRL